MYTIEDGGLNNTAPKFENDTSRDKKDAGFYVLLIMMGIGIIAIISISAITSCDNSTCKHSFWPIIGLSIVTALAAAVCGGFLGFLFGIPRSLQKKSVDNTSVSSVSYANNTNLEEISDWLTKIIVGVSLTQLPAIKKDFDALTSSVSYGFSSYLDSKFSYPYVGAIIVFFAVCGFFAVYLWSRIYLFEILNRLDKTIADIVANEVDAKVEDKFALQKQEAKIKLWEERKKEFEKQRDRVLAAESVENIKQMLAIAQPAPVTVLDDCQKNRWGNTSTANGFEVVAAFSQNVNETDYYNVTLTVQPVAGNTTELHDVYFFMHDSFFPKIIVTASVLNNKAVYDFVSFEAFTVGVILNGGTSKLEIDLNNLANAPESYKYKDELYTYETIKSELQKLGAL